MTLHRGCGCGDHRGAPRSSSTTPARSPTSPTGELAQYFPRPGWVEHDATENHRPRGGATLLEVAGRIAERGGAGRRPRHHQPARDGGRLGPLHRGAAPTEHRLGRNKADNGATAGRCARRGHLDLGALAHRAPCSTPISRPRRWLARRARGACPSDTGSATWPWARFDSLGALAPERGPSHGGVFRHRPDQRQPGPFSTTSTRAPGSPTKLGARSSCRARPSLADVRPSCGRFAVVSAAALGDGGRGLAGVPISGNRRRTSRPLLVRPGLPSPPAWSKATYGTRAKLCAGQRPERSAHRRPPGCLTTVAWDLGGHGGEGRPAPPYALEGSAFRGRVRQSSGRATALPSSSAPRTGAPLAGSVARQRRGSTVGPAFPRAWGAPGGTRGARGTINRPSPGAGPRPAPPGPPSRPWPTRSRAMVEAMVRRRTGTPG